MSVPTRRQSDESSETQRAASYELLAIENGWKTCSVASAVRRVAVGVVVDEGHRAWGMVAATHRRDESLRLAAERWCEKHPPWRYRHHLLALRCPADPMLRSPTSVSNEHANQWPDFVAENPSARHTPNAHTACHGARARASPEKSSSPASPLASAPNDKSSIAPKPLVSSEQAIGAPASIHPRRSCSWRYSALKASTPRAP